MRTRLSALCSAALLLASPAFAEANKINIHIEPGIGSGLNQAFFVTGASLKVDLALISIGPVAPSVEFVGMGSTSVNYLPVGALFGGGIGLRWRILNDEKGYRFVRGGKNGNWWGNLWLDAHFVVANDGVGFDVGMGYEFSLIDGLQVGPFASFRLAGPDQMLLGGLSFSAGGPSEVPADYDPDNDGIKGAADKCPTEAEDKDGFEDDDGCPDLDNDKDGIPDVSDKCPNEPEDKDGFEDTDGCPDPDNDKDGVLDAADKCPDKAGPADNGGCPWGDKDGDGIADNVDKCPDQAEDKDGFEDEDGCPDPDNDKDGIPDVSDKCPNEPETVNGIDDTDGCPEKEATVFVTKEKIVITEKVNFDPEKATIKADSNALLDKVAELIKKFPNIKKVRVEGHTDDIKDEAFNMKLSQQRSEAVRDALIKRGVDKGRLEAQGFGKTRPLDTSKTEDARAKNRRVEFVIVDQS